jgi:hypothetical protein
MSGNQARELLDQIFLYILDSMEINYEKE